MTETTVYLSPNGQDRTSGAGPATRLYIATIAGLAVLERAGPGADWALKRRTLTECHFGQLVFEPRSGKLFAGMHDDGGLWVSDDGEGLSWRRLENGLTEKHIYALAARSHGGSTTLFAGTSPAALFRSDDLGESWVNVEGILSLPDIDKWTFPPPPHIPHVKHIVFHPGEPDTVFFCVEQGGLFRSTDDGKSWVEISSYARPDDGAFKDIHRLLINPENHAEFYLATGEGLYRSTDAGASWKHVIKRAEEIGYPDFLQFDPEDKRTVFVAGAARNPGGWYKEKRADSSIVVTHDSGASWTKLGNGLPDPMVPAFQAMSLHEWPGGMSLVIATATGEIYWSDDRGVHWTCIAQGLPPISKDEHHLPFIGKQAGSNQYQREGWAHRSPER